MAKQTPALKAAEQAAERELNAIAERAQELAASRERVALVAARRTCDEPGCDAFEGPHEDGKCRKHSRRSMAVKQSFEEQLQQEIAVEATNLVMRGARIAAMKGRVNQVREALELAGLAEPKESSSAGGPGGVIVQIGITLPGLPGGAQID